jgi:hypothetical protein
MGAMPPEDMYFTAENFDAMVEQHKSCDMIVTLIGLPMDMQAMKFWHIDPAERPKLVVAFGSVYELMAPIEADFVSAAVSYNPKYEYDEKEEVPEDYTEAFNRRYLLIDAANIKQIHAENPGMFMVQEKKKTKKKK